MNAHEIHKLVVGVLGADLHQGRQQIDSVLKRIRSLEALQAMRENADLIRRIYDEYPNLDGVTFNFYPWNPDEMAFYLSDTVSEGDRDDSFGVTLQSVLASFSVDHGVAGALKSDGDMLKFNNVLTKENNGVRALETTRTQVDAAMRENGINALAYALFADAWNKNKDQVLSLAGPAEEVNIPQPPQDHLPITANCLQYIERALAEHPNLLERFADEAYLRYLGDQFFTEDHDIQPWLSAAKSFLNHKGMHVSTLARIGNTHFGSVIPQSWYDASQALVREVGASAQALDRPTRSNTYTPKG